jgi:ubiquinone/menaquinone biosynthesis C-methylase UbiE
VGCGGGRTIGKLAAIVTEGKVYGVDYSEQSIAVSKKTNAKRIDLGRVQLQQASVSQLPFRNGMFDLVTAVETHFWWPDLASDIREVFRVIRPGGTVILIAEVYKGAQTRMSQLIEKAGPRVGLKLLTVEEHRELLTHAGCTDIQVIEQHKKGWICAVGRKPPTPEIPSHNRMQ